MRWVLAGALLLGAGYYAGRVHANYDTLKAWLGR